MEFRPTLRLALPLIFAELGWMSMGVVDTIMVGRLPNSAVAIGATGLGQSLYNSVAIFGGGLLLGRTPSSRKRMDATTFEMPGTRS
jgi:MATE family multidrug resistance protein